MKKIKKIGIILTGIGVVIYLITCFVFIKGALADTVSAITFLFLSFSLTLIGISLFFLDLILAEKHKAKKIALFVLLIFFIVFVADAFITGYIPKYVAETGIDKKSKSMCDLLSIWSPFEFIGTESYHSGIPIMGSPLRYLRENCYEEAAIANRDLDLCHKIFYWEGCYTKIAVATKDESICKKIIEKGTGPKSKYEVRVARCYKELAIIKKDKNLCELVKYENLKSECLEQVGKLQDINKQINYYKDLAKKTKDETWCQKLENARIQSDCYTDLAKETNDEKYCGKIEVPGMPEIRADCYGWMAFFKNDPSICWEVETASLSSSCWDHFGMKEWKSYRFSVQKLRDTKGLTQSKQREVEKKIAEQQLKGCSFEIKYPSNWVAYTWPLHGVIIPAGLFIEEDKETHKGCSFQMSFQGNPEKEKYCFPISYSGGKECNRIFNQMLSTFRFLE